MADKLIEDFPFEESGYARGKMYWKASTLYKYVKKKKLKPFMYPLAAINISLSYPHLNKGNLDTVIYHTKRSLNSDPDIPIILDNLGQIADGMHRVIKAFCEDREYIMAYRLMEMPEPDEIRKKEE